MQLDIGTIYTLRSHSTAKALRVSTISLSMPESLWRSAFLAAECMLNFLGHFIECIIETYMNYFHCVIFPL